ncbi:MAG: dihydroorotate dehydrogenase electron transfer subunit [Candidatus Nanoarchaeia archaeon]
MTKINGLNEQNKKEQPKALKINSIKNEAEDVKTFTFKNKIDAVPGQFVMLWIPRIGMKPFGVSGLDEYSFSVTVSRVGNFTSCLFEKKQGEYVGVSGPYGKGFSTKRKNPILVAGGYGSAPLALLAECLEKEGANVTLIIGARNERYITFKDRFKESSINVVYCTDDGSKGIKGFTTDALEEVLKKKECDFIYTVGPEIMMKKVIDISDVHGIDCEASIERYMKCGFGICGQCCVDGTGERLCTNGPVYNKDYIKDKITEFGLYKRDVTGRLSSF